MPGTFLLTVPFFRIFGHAEHPTAYPAGIGAAAISATGIWLANATLKRILPWRSAVAAAVILGLATATWTVSADGPWAHGTDQLSILLAIFFLARSAYAAAGLSLAIGILARPHVALIAAVSGCWAAWRQRAIRPLLTVGLTSFLGIAGLIVYNWKMFGRPSVLGHYSGHVAAASSTVQSSSFLINIAGTFFSPLRGLFLLSPFLLLLLPGLPKAWKAAPWWVRSSAVGGLAYLAAQLAGNYFAGGTGFYSYRLSLETLTAATPLLAVSYMEWTQHRHWRRWAFGILAVLSVGIHALGAFSWHEAPDVPIAAWTRYQPWIALQQASVTKLLIVAGCMVVAALVLRWCASVPETPDAATADLADHREAAVLR